MSYIPPRRSDGTIQHTRVKQPWPKDRLFRILSIDGGGIRGIFPAAYLAQLELRFLGGKSIGDCFDLVAGTSTGGIIALGLAHGMTAQQVLGVYMERGETIFPASSPLTGPSKFVRSLFRPKHDSSILKDELLQIFGTKVLDAASVRLVIPSFEGEYGEPFLYKTPHHPDYQNDRHQRFAHVALHTAAAPAYFAPVENDGYVMIDGGVWANNPVMNALVDVLACYDVPRENIRILTIGTGDETVRLAKKHLNGGMLAWGFSKQVPILFRLAARAQSKNALGQAFLLAGKNHVIRVDIDERDQQLDLDDVRRAKTELPNIARSHAESNGHLVQEIFLKDLADKFIRCETR